MEPDEQPPRWLRLRVLRDVSIRRVLLLGFTAVFGLWLLSAYDLARRVADADAETTALMTRFTEGEEVLFTIRAEVILSSVYIRDAALDARPNASAFYRDQLRMARVTVDEAVQRYVPNADSVAEREQWTRLQSELQEYWRSMSPALDGWTAGSTADALAFLRDEVIPRRQTVIRISNDIRALNQAAVQDQQGALGELHRAVRDRIWWTSGIAVALGLVVAWLATRQVAGLESRIRQQHLQEQRHKRDLQRLSSQLVQAQETERRTIARDLHDEIGQALMTVKLDLGIIEQSGGQLTGGAARALGEARSTMDLAIHSVRDLSQVLRPPMLDDFGLALTLDGYIRRFSERTGVPTELVLDRMDERLPAELELCAYRVVQEALTNVAKHARARSCRVFVQRLPCSLLLTVEDDGRGMDPEGMKYGESQPGVGMVGMRERVAGLGGTVRLETSPGKGTRLAIELPVRSGDSVTPEAPSDTGAPAVA